MSVSRGHTRISGTISGFRPAGRFRAQFRTLRLGLFLGLFLAPGLACLPAAQASAAESNGGNLSYQGGENVTGIPDSYGPPGHETAGEYANSGTLTGRGGPGGSIDGSGEYSGGSGLSVGGAFSNSGTVYGHGGDGGSGAVADGGSGLWVGGAFSNSGAVHGYGGDGGSGVNAHGGSGLWVGGAFSNSGTVYGHGGDGGSAYGTDDGSGLWVGGAFSNSGTVHGYGGDGGSEYGSDGGSGLSVSGAFSNSGTVYGYGGDGGSEYGAYGGSGLWVGGAFSNSGTVHGYGGDGGSGMNAYGGSGLSVNSAFSNSGTVYGYGGDGGSGERAYGGDGLSVNSAFSNSGTVYGYGGDGGSGQEALGGFGVSMLSGSAFTNHGLAAFRGGATGSGLDAFGGYGLFTSDGSSNRGSLALFSGPGQYAVGLHSNTYGVHGGMTFTLGSGSLLLAGPGQYAGIDALSYLGDAQNVAMESGARFHSLATAGLAPGQSHAHRLVVRANEVSGDFAPHDGPVLFYAYQKSGASPDVEYTATVTRKAYASDFTGGPGSVLASGLERAFAESGAGMENLHWAMLLADLEHQPDAASVRSTAASAARRVLPLDTAQGARSLVRGARLADGVASTRLRAFADNREATAAEWRASFAPQSLVTASGPGGGALSGSGVAGGSGHRFGMWLQPFAAWGEQRGGSGYNNLDEHYRGASLGLAWDTGPAALSLSGHYIRTELDASGYDADADALGLALGLGRRFRINETFAPWAELRLGWTGYELRQERKDYAGATASSRPDVNIYSAGLLVDNDFAFGPVTLTPHLGLDYAYLDMDTYTEHGGDYALRGEPGGLPIPAGPGRAGPRLQALPSLTLNGRAVYYLEMADNRAKLRTSAVTLPSLSVTARGDDLDRSSGSVGAGFSWQASGNVSIGLDYDFGFGDKYTGHGLTGMFRVTF